MARSLQITWEDHHPLAIVKLSGYLAQLEVYRLKTQMEIINREGHRYVVFDLGEVEFIDSAGIGAIVQLRSDCTTGGGQFLILRPKSEQVQQAMDRSSLSEIFEPFEDIKSALDYLYQRFGVQPLKVLRQNTAADEDLLSNIKRMIQRLDQVEKRLGRIEYLLGEKKAGS